MYAENNWRTVGRKQTPSIIPGIYQHQVEKLLTPRKQNKTRKRTDALYFNQIWGKSHRRTHASTFFCRSKHLPGTIKPMNHPKPSETTKQSTTTAPVTQTRRETGTRNVHRAQRKNTNRLGLLFPYKKLYKK